MKKSVQCFLFLLFVANSKAFLLDFSTEQIQSGTFQNVTFNLTFNGDLDEMETFEDEACVVLTFNWTNLESWAVNARQDRVIFSKSDIAAEIPKTLSLEGVIIGYNDLQVYAHIDSLDAVRRKSEFSKLPIKLPDELNDFLDTSKKPHHEVQRFDSSHGGIKVKESEEKFFREARQISLRNQVRILMQQRKIEVILDGGSETLTEFFTIVVTLMIVLNTINMGGQLDFEVIKSVFKSPVGPIVGMVSQFVLMPMFAFAVGWVSNGNDLLFRLGLFVLGTCPGGTASNFWCILLEGDINLSITMTFMSTIAALGMMPLWLYLMGPLLVDDDLVIPFGQLIFSLISYVSQHFLCCEQFFTGSINVYRLTAPLALGMWIRYRWIQAAPYMDKIIVPFTLITILFIFTAGVYINWFLFQLMTTEMIIAGFVVCGAGYVFGGGLAWLFRLKLPQIKAVSIETAFQNGSLAFIILKISLPPPYGDLSTVAPVAQLVITAIPLWIMLGVFKLWQLVLKPKYFSKPSNEDEIIEPINQQQF